MYGHPTNRPSQLDQGSKDSKWNRRMQEKFRGLFFLFCFPIVFFMESFLIYFLSKMVDPMMSLDNDKRGFIKC